MATNTETTEKPIIFRAEEVRAILEGRKCQTRSLIKPQPGTTAELFQWEGSNTWQANGLLCDVKMGPWECPYWIGLRLWVRETWAVVGSNEGTNAAIYRADNTGYVGKCRSPIHMPRWASRLTLEITDVRCQRLGEISEDDAKAEGVEASEWVQNNDGSPCYSLPFQDLWNRVQRDCAGEGAWGRDRDKWVWVLTFKRID